MLITAYNLLPIRFSRRRSLPIPKSRILFSGGNLRLESLDDAIGIQS